MADEEEPVGYRRPPRLTRFRKGQSGNPKGRPKGRKRDIPHDSVLGQIVVVREGQVERSVSAAEAFLLYLVKQGFEGDDAAAKLAREAMTIGKTFQTEVVDMQTTFIFGCEPRHPNRALEALKMATKLGRYRPSARLMLEPWIVEAALARLGDRRLTPEQQATVVQATRMPGKVRWPYWWERTPG